MTVKRVSSFDKLKRFEASQPLLSSLNSHDKKFSIIPSLKDSFNKLVDSYNSKTLDVIKFIDKYLLFQFLFGLLIIAFCIVTKRRNYQAFVGTEMSCVGSFVFAGILIIFLLLYFPFFPFNFYSFLLLNLVILRIKLSLFPFSNSSPSVFSSKDEQESPSLERIMMEFIIPQIILQLFIAGFVDCDL